MTPTLRIFLSSTAIDMQEHRQKVIDAILRLDHMPVMMESFGAIPKTPVEVCKSKVLECDAIVVMLAHRYGWVPTIDDGGDGKKSITWIEVETALENDIPVYAFIVDPTFGWALPKEQDLIAETNDDKKIAEIVKSIQSLKEFKIFLDSKSGITRDKFTTPENLATKVATSLKDLSPSSDTSVRLTPKSPDFIFRIVHPLQPAPHFRGRKQLLDELKQWWHTPVTPDRVRSLVAIGGTGKTAVVERFLESIKHEPLRGNILVWSFYDEPNTDAFLREACIVFTGVEPDGVGGILEKLQRALSAESRQNLIVLDGLERVQSEGNSGSERAKGDLEDFRIKNLLRTIAIGLGNTRALITSRFKLTDLNQWENAGYKSHDLDFLDKDTAIEVLKAWGIKGNNETLAKMAESVGRHALSISVLGSYLNHYCGGAPDGIKEFKLDEIADGEPLAARLGRILDGYAKSLPTRERDLLIRLSVFPKGVSVDILGYLIKAGGEIAGTLIGANQHRLLIIAEKLKLQGLIYSYNRGNTIMYTAHPFLRDYFRTLLGIKPEDIHDVVKNNLAIGLNTKPKNKPTDIATLDKYEQLIEHSILSDHYQEAYDLYENVMRGGGAGVNHLFFTLGDYGRIIRIISLFSEDGTPLTFTKKLSANSTGILITLWGLVATMLGDLKTAELCFNMDIELALKTKNNGNISINLQNRAKVSLVRGLFPNAKKFLESSLSYLITEDNNEHHIKYVKKSDNAFLAYALHFIGEIAMAKLHFSKATDINGEPLYADNGCFETEHLIAIGEKEKANNLLLENLNKSEQAPWQNSISSCHYWLGVLALPHSTADARRHLQKIREWTEKSGAMECIIQSSILASEIAYCSADYTTAIVEAMTGSNHAENCGYGKYAIELLLQLSKIHSAIPDHKAALSFARQALDRSALPECGNAWGQADGGHLCGVCHLALGEYELARQRFSAALILREKIAHPEAGETRKLLEELKARK